MPDSIVVEASPDWLTYVHPTFPTERSVWVQARDHVEGLWALTESQSESFGPVLRSTATALRRALGAECVYLISFGENHKHFHAVLIARTSEDGEGSRGISLAGRTLTDRGTSDTKGAAEMAALIRSGLPPREIS